GPRAQHMRTRVRAYGRRVSARGGGVSVRAAWPGRPARVASGPARVAPGRRFAVGVAPRHRNPAESVLECCTNHGTVPTCNTNRHDEAGMTVPGEDGPDQMRQAKPWPAGQTRPARTGLSQTSPPHCTPGG